MKHNASEAYYAAVLVTYRQRHVPITHFQL